MKKNKNILEVVEDENPPLLALLEKLAAEKKEIILKISAEEGIRLSATDEKETLAAMAIVLFVAEQNLKALQQTMPRMITEDFLMRMTFAYHKIASDSMKK